MQETDEWRGSAANSQIFVQNRLEQWLQELLLACSYARHRKRNLEFAFLEFNNWEAPKDRPIFSQVVIVGGAKPMISDLVPRCGNSEPLRHFEPLRVRLHGSARRGRDRPDMLRRRTGVRPEDPRLLVTP